MGDPDVYDHLRAGSESGAGVEPGVYRVVGRPDDAVTLLRVGDADGRRVNTGELASVSREDLDRFEPAANPDGNRSPGAKLAGLLDGLAWQARTFARALASNPLPAAVGLALLAAGLFGDRFVSLSENVEGLLILAGSLSLAAVAWRDGR